MRKKSLLLALLLALGTTLQAKANLFQNGGFEAPGAALTTNYVAVGAGSQITDWTTAVGNGSNANVYYAHANSTASWIPNPSEGSYCVQLDSTSGSAYTVGSSISQAVNLVAGQTYQLTFDINTEVGAGKGGTANLALNISGSGYNSNGNLLFTATNPADVSRANAQWTSETFTFTATGSGATTFKFADAPSSCNNNVALDCVVLQQFVPEFSHWSVFAGFGGVLAAVQAGRRLLGRATAARRRVGGPVVA